MSEWLSGEKIIGLDHEPVARKLCSLCLVFNQLSAFKDHVTWLGLECYHELETRLDTCIRGGFELFQLNGIIYPEWLSDLSKSLQGNKESGSPLSDTFHVEFDQFPDGFSLSGFFQQLRFKDKDVASSLPVITEYLELIDRFRICRPGMSRSLARFINEVGSPVQIGMMSRGSTVVKLISHLDKENLETTKMFTAHNYNHLFTSRGLDVELIYEAMNECLAFFAFRASVDLDLTHDAFLPRFSLELSLLNPQHLDCESTDCLKRLLERIGVSSSAIADFNRLCKQLPRGIKRPVNIWSDDIEKLWISYSHLKVCIDLNTSSIKSYIAAHLSR